MNRSKWVLHFELNRLHRPEPHWNVVSPLTTEVCTTLAHSLSHFQLGESGEGRFLLTQVQRHVPQDPEYAQALGLFVAEEKEHARLLQKLVERFGGSTVGRHWTHALFRLTRRALGFKFEIQVLVIAELVGSAYYRLLQRRARDLVLDEVCGLILRDESNHIAFHCDWLRGLRSGWLPWECAAWNLQFQLLFTIATNIAWTDHRKALLVTGASKREFSVEARRECISFLRSLEQTAAQFELAPRGPSPGGCAP